MNVAFMFALVALQLAGVSSEEISARMYQDSNCKSPIDVTETRDVVLGKCFRALSGLFVNVMCSSFDNMEIVVKYFADPQCLDRVTSHGHAIGVAPEIMTIREGGFWHLGFGGIWPDAFKGTSFSNVCYQDLPCEVHSGKTGCPGTWKKFRRVDRTSSCTDCDPGFHRVNNHCLPNTCTCPGGTAATGTECKTPDAEMCARCDPGYAKTEEMRCEALPCTCNGGEVAAGDCVQPGAKVCTTCHAGYTMKASLCIENVCTCSGGPPATGSLCPRDGLALCADQATPKPDENTPFTSSKEFLIILVSLGTATLSGIGSFVMWWLKRRCETSAEVKTSSEAGPTVLGSNPVGETKTEAQHQASGEVVQKQSGNFCSRCGAQRHQGSNFCTGCGVCLEPDV